MKTTYRIPALRSSSARYSAALAAARSTVARPAVGRAVPLAKSSDTLRAEIIDGLTTILGLLTFSAVAMFFLVLAS